MITIMEMLQKYTAENPNAPILFDDAHSKGITYTQFDEMTGKVYAWLKRGFCPYKPSQRCFSDHCHGRRMESRGGLGPG